MQKSKIIEKIREALAANGVDEVMFSRMGIRHQLRSNKILFELQKELETTNIKKDD